MTCVKPFTQRRPTTEMQASISREVEYMDQDLRERAGGGDRWHRLATLKYRVWNDLQTTFWVEKQLVSRGFLLPFRRPSLWRQIFLTWSQHTMDWTSTIDSDLRVSLTSLLSFLAWDSLTDQEAQLMTTALTSQLALIKGRYPERKIYHSNMFWPHFMKPSPSQASLPCQYDAILLS